MATEQSILAVIRAARLVFRSRHDKAAFAVHAAFVAAGYALHAIGPSTFADDALSISSAEMAEGTYVKLTKDQNLQEITPGELNQPIDVAALNAPRCEECGQILPPSYSPPADEDWMTGIFGCSEDHDSCLTGLFCPCLLFGRNVANLNDEITEQSACFCHAICVEGGIALAITTAACHGIDPDTACLLTEGLFFAWWVCGIYTGMARQSLQRKYHLKNSPCDPCMVHCCLHWCAICQEHREMKKHLAEGNSSEATVTKPPSVQEMNAAEKPETAPSSSPRGNNLQLLPI